ncbi:MAG: FAD-dependent oxidoreductase [Candidatus Hodarchaeota archaeon]
MDISDFLLNQTARKRALEQRRARTLLFEGIESSSKHAEQQFPQIKDLLDQLSDATDVFFPEPVQQEIYSADTGTHIMPEIFKNLLADIKLSFIIRPGCVEDLQRFVKWAGENRCNYTVRGAGTYPFGGCVPLKDDVVVDLSYLDFLELDEEHEALLIGAGVLFPDARKYLQERGYALRQETTNRNSGTVAGWIATGGIGLGRQRQG